MLDKFNAVSFDYVVDNSGLVHRVRSQKEIKVVAVNTREN